MFSFFLSFLFLPFCLFVYLFVCLFFSSFACLSVCHSRHARVQGQGSRSDFSLLKIAHNLQSTPRLARLRQRRAYNLQHCFKNPLHPDRCSTHAILCPGRVPPVGIDGEMPPANGLGLGLGFFRATQSALIRTSRVQALGLGLPHIQSSGFGFMASARPGFRPWV